MILVILVFIWILKAVSKNEYGQAFEGYEYLRNPEKEYSHRKKRKRFQDGKYHYF